MLIAKTASWLRQNLFSPSLHVFLAVLLCSAVTFSQMQGKWSITPYADSVSYLAVAVPLYQEGVITNGNFPYDAVGVGPDGEGMFFAPLYPAFLEVLISISSDFRQTAFCAVEKRRAKIIAQECQPLHLETLIFVQGLFAILAGGLVWVAAFLLTNRLGLSWLAMTFVLWTKSYADHATIIMTESLVLPLFTLGTITALLSFRKSSLWLGAATGVVLALLALTRPSFSFLFYFSAAILIPFAFFWLLRGTRKKLVLVAAVFLASYAAVVAPWIVRNGTKIGVWDISAGYGPFTLAQRVSYNSMTWKEGISSLILALPGFGDNLGEALLSPQTIEKFSYDSPNGFYMQGNRVLRPKEREEAGSVQNFQSHLIHKYILGEPIRHTLVTLVMAWRGMWVGKDLAFLAIPAFFAFLIRCLVRRELNILFFAIPPLFMLGLHAFTSVNIIRYNLILLPVVGISFSWAVLEIGKILRRKFFSARTPSSLARS
jgi:hypothetical protein